MERERVRKEEAKKQADAEKKLLAEVGVAKQLSENAIPLREWQDGEMSGVRGARWLPGQRARHDHSATPPAALWSWRAR